MPAAQIIALRTLLKRAFWGVDVRFDLVYIMWDVPACRVVSQLKSNMEMHVTISAFFWLVT